MDVIWQSTRWNPSPEAQLPGAGADKRVSPFTRSEFGADVPSSAAGLPSANGVSLQRNRLHYTLWGLLELHKALFAFYHWKLFLKSVACQ